MSKFLKKLKDEILIIDGAMGTTLMEAGITVGSCFEELNLSNPDIIKSIHAKYIEAGADIIETNTFSANRLKLKEYGLEKKLKKINKRGIEIAKEAAGSKILVAASMGPLGALMEPMGTITFDEAYEIFKEQAMAIAEAGADLISIETISDLAEIRAAVIAVKDATSLPVIAHMTFSDDGFTVTGTPPKAAAVVMSALGVDAIGANCSSGPEPLINVARELVKYSKVPVSVMPNAGMPQLKGDVAVYSMTPAEFGSFSKKFAEIGVRIIGGCCGTNYKHIQAAREFAKSVTKKHQYNQDQPVTRLSSRTKIIELSDNLPSIKIGERINPTARKALSEEISAGIFKTVRDDAVSQTKAGADILDINMGVPEIDEKKTIKSAINIIQSASNLPLSIDSSNPSVIEEGLKTFVGKALINSVSAKKNSMEKILPLAKKYGAAIIGLTLDEKGIPIKAEDKFKLAEKIVKGAVNIGIPKEDIFIDSLVLSAGAQQKDVLETLKAITLIKEKLSVRTSLGISNVSHGLPNRKLLNKTFLSMALGYGLDAAIVNPLEPTIIEAFSGSNVLTNRDVAAKNFINQLPDIQNSNSTGIKQAVIEGNAEIIIELIEKEIINGKSPQDIIDKELLSGIEIVGERFSKGQYFLPQVMASAETVKKGFERVKAEIPSEKVKIAGTVIVATVKGDIHDIGKNIVAMMLENNSFRVIDLGKDVSADLIVEKSKKFNPDIILLSALLTTTMPYMKTVKEKLAEAGLNIPLMIGGAVITEGYASRINANFSKDAIEAVKVAKNIIGKGDN